MPLLASRQKTSIDGIAMKFDIYSPMDILKPFILRYVISENEMPSAYKVFPSTGLVVGFQYKGQLSTLKENVENKLRSAGITGISDSYKTFKNSVDTGTVLVYFTEFGFCHFNSHPANELFNLSLTLEDVFDRYKTMEVMEKLVLATTDIQRVQIVEEFLLSQLKDIKRDLLIEEAVKIIYQSKGTIRIKDLIERLFISQSPFEKRFRKVVGTTPKKFTSIVRFNTVLESLGKTESLTKICYENNFFDQAHFIKNFKQFTGDTPENFKRFL